MVLLVANSAPAQNEPPERAVRNDVAAQWKTDEVRTADGKLHRGLIQFERPGEMEFVEVVRPPGRPMFLVVRPIDPLTIVASRRLSPEDREQLRQRIHRFRNRARIEAGRMEDVSLQSVRRDGVEYRHFEGVWFTLNSTADDETTRRCIVRIEQVFRAYRQLIRPRREASGNLQVLLLGSMEHYYDYLRQRRWNIGNPAFFSARDNLIVAGSEMTPFAEHLAEVRAENARRRQHYQRRNAEMPAELVALADRLAAAGFAGEEIGQEVAARRAAWENQYREALREIERINRRNDARFAEVTGPMFERLYHEAFHAYLENFVYPHQQFDVPTWLNEGLAQVFESGQLDDGATLRIDAPDADLLAAVQADLATEAPMTLAELLRSRPGDFLVTRSQEQTRSNRHYATAWALAYYLMFYQDVVEADALDRYVQRRDERIAPVEWFERLIGMPLAQFEPTWRDAIRGMSPPRR